MYGWMNRFLRLGQPEPIVEEDFVPLTRAEATVWDDAHPAPPDGEASERAVTRWWSEQSDRHVAAIRPHDKDGLDRYRAIFRLQQGGDWPGADALIAQLADRQLLGHVLAQRYLHPTAYRSAYPELKDWLEQYADLPGAQQIYRLAGVRRQKGDAPAREPTAVLRRLGTPDSGGEPTGLSKAPQIAAPLSTSFGKAALRSTVGSAPAGSDSARVPRPKASSIEPLSYMAWPPVNPGRIPGAVRRGPRCRA